MRNISPETLIGTALTYSSLGLPKTPSKNFCNRFNCSIFSFKWSNTETTFLYNLTRFFFDCANLLIEKQKNQRNEHNFNKIVLSALKIGMILGFIIIYPLHILLSFLSTLRENGPCMFKVITSINICVYLWGIEYCS